MKTFLIGGDLGDAIAGLPSIRHLGGGELWLQTQSGTKPWSPERWDAIRPLLEIQPYLTSVKLIPENEVATPDYNLSTFRSSWGKHPTLIGKQAVHLGINPDDLDLSPWLTIPEAPKHGKIIACRSERNQGFIHFHLLWRYHHQDCFFVGLEQEYKTFCYNCTPYTPGTKPATLIPHKPTANLLEVAQLISGSRLLVCNLSAPLWVAYGLGFSPIILEAVCEDSTLNRPGVRIIRQPQDNPDTQEWGKL